MARDGERGRGDWKARLGSRNSGPYAEASGDTGPVDIAAVRRDDALIDAIASDGPVSTDSAEEYQLATLLADWRAELIAPPMSAEPDLDAIVAAVNQEIGARQVRIGAHSGGRLRLLRPIAGTAAALALVFGGMTAFSYNAEPGDPLWRVKEVVFSEQAQTTVVQRADNDLAEASTLVAQDPVQAKARLERAKENATQINDPQKRNEVMTEWDRLLVELRKWSPELADQLDTTVPKSGEPRPTSDTHATSKPKPTSGSTAPTILQQPVEPSGKPSAPSGKPSDSTDATTPNGSKPTTASPPVVTTPQQPPVEPTTQVQSPPTAPDTGSKPTVAVPTGDTGPPSVPPPQQPITRVPTQIQPTQDYQPPTIVIPGLPGVPGSSLPGR
ncbi:anti-sigma-D factor RsdA [Nocardia sp. NBC_00881]|uniref:anti-sigma-D factor RsdA n=1 Tax=Nocardia sp. NBC_00881 TaxID=2975995 RepID=UPI00386F886D|nr:anti-sigma-D factor RsdA [Nocardia sp. NBC_00881]